VKPGNIIDVFVVAQGAGANMDVFGVFLTKRQADGYVKEQLAGIDRVDVIPHKAFRPDTEERVLLVEHWANFYELSVNYEPDEDRIRRELRQSAWSKLTPEERNVLNLEEPLQ